MPAPAASTTVAARLHEIERALRIIDLALASCRAALAALRRSNGQPPRDEIGRFAAAALDRDGLFPVLGTKTSQ